MLRFIYEWIENIVFYLIVLVVIMQIIPNSSYQKYVRFFAGMILILMLAVPILKIFDMERYQDTEYQSVLREIEEASRYMEFTIGEEDAFGD